MYLAKDTNGKVHLWLNKPHRWNKGENWFGGSPSERLLIPKDLWKTYHCENLTNDDDPIEVDIVIK